MSRHKNRSVSKRLVASYILDWIVILIIAAIGGGLNYIKPVHRPFSLLDLTISFPYVPELITTTTLVCVSLLAPALLIALIVFLIVPGPSFSRTSTRAKLWRLKLWEFEKGWAGLALSLAAAFTITQALKNMFGKPRPDLLARCQPDLSGIAAHVVGGLGQDISARWTLVDSGICMQTDAAFLNDGFRSWPSGHSSFSWSGLLYLSLFICSKFAITIPYLGHRSAPQILHSDRSNDHPLLPLHNSHCDSTEDAADKAAHETDSSPPNLQPPLILRDRSATPPNFLLLLPAIPIAVAVFITSTRFAEFYHHGFDVLSGSLIGIFSAWFAFRWYHAPIRSGEGWAWGARSREKAFWIGVGTAGYSVDDAR